MLKQKTLFIICNILFAKPNLTRITQNNFLPHTVMNYTLSTMGVLFMLHADSEKDLDDKLLLLCEASGIDFKYRVTQTPTILNDYVTVYAKIDELK